MLHYQSGRPLALQTRERAGGGGGGGNLLGEKGRAGYWPLFRFGKASVDRGEGGGGGGKSDTGASRGGEQLLARESWPHRG